MQRIDILCVGKIKEKYFVEAVREYSKRLSRYCRLNITEVQDEPTPDEASEHEEELIKKKEEERIRKHLRPDTYLIVLSIDGKKLDSESFSATLERLSVTGKSHLTFVIGGSLGLTEELTEQADLQLSFSDFTFPHQLMRVILLEQIYRAFRIMNHEPYHK